MSISNYGELKQKLSRYLFNQRFLADYDDYTTMFEADANSRLRVLPMEASVLLTTVSGDVALPADYLLWRTVRPTLTATPGPTFHQPFAELDYVHPAYLPPVGRGYNHLFTIEGNTFKARPVDDRTGAYEFHYYQKVPTLVDATTGNLATNWLLTEYPNAYLFGVITELAAV